MVRTHNQKIAVATSKRTHGVEYSSMWLNERGSLNALNAERVHIATKLLLYTSDAFCRPDRNYSMHEIADRQKSWIELYKNYGYNIETFLDLDELTVAAAKTEEIIESPFMSPALHSGDPLRFSV